VRSTFPAYTGSRRLETATRSSSIAGTGTDGNGRVAFVALQTALLSQGMHAIVFDDLRRHDEALGHALRDDDKRDARPLARLVVERATAAGAVERIS
jgi:hypothetical protein